MFPGLAGSPGHSPECSASVESLQALDLISCLPKELALNVFRFLEARDLISSSQTCRLWRYLAEDDVLWRNKNSEIGLPDERCLLQTPSFALDGFQKSPWKMNYQRHYRIDANWRSGTSRVPKLVNAHTGFLITCLLFTDNNRIISGSDDGSLRVWSVETGDCVFSLFGHTGGVWAADVEGAVLVSGSTDRTLRVWNLTNGRVEATLHGHSSTVRCLALRNGICVSGSRDCTLRMWQVQITEPGALPTILHNSCIGVLQGHGAAVRCVRFNGEYIVSGSYDHQIRVWSAVEKKCLHVLTGHTHRIYSLQFDGIHVVSGSLDTSIRVWDVKTGALKHVLVGHESLISGMHQRDHILISGNADATVRMWDIRTGTCLKTLGSADAKHESAVTSVHFDQNFVVTSSDDGTVKLWDLHTGQFIRNIVTLTSRSSGGVVWRIIANKTKLVCAVGSRDRNNQITNIEETKIILFDFDTAV